MPSTYSSDLKLELMANGENAGTWGTKTNTNLNLLQQAIAGFELITITNGTTNTLLMNNATISQARNAVIKFDTITLSTATTVTIPDSIEKLYLFDCTAVTAATNLTIKTASGTGFTCDASRLYFAYANGTNLIEVSLDNLGGQISETQIADDAVTNAKIGTGAVDTAELATDAVTNAKMADDSVNTAELVDDAVTAAKLARKFTISTSAPSGGNDGDIWLQYS